MIRRVIAAIVALLLGLVGIILVVNYAQRADERAVADLETVEVLVAKVPIAKGTRADSLNELVTTQKVPRKFVPSGSIDDLQDVAGKLVNAPIVAGEQLVGSRFESSDEARASEDFVLPDEALNLHQVTIPLDTPRALGGNIAPGDLVGVFVSVQPQDAPEGETKPSMTHLQLQKVLVVRVEGARIEVPADTTSTETTDQAGSGLTGATTDGEQNATQVSKEVVMVTLALEGPDAEKLVFGMEWGKVWLSLEPEDADESGTRIVVLLLPQLASDLRDVFE